MRNPIPLTLIIVLAVFMPLYAQIPTRIQNMQLVGTVAPAPQVRLTLSDGSVVDADIDTTTLRIWFPSGGGKPILSGIPGAGLQSIDAGPSGALQITELSGVATIDVVTALVPLKASVNAFAGLNIFDLGVILTPRSPPASPTNGQIWYDSFTGKFRCHEGSVTKNCTGGSGSGSSNRVYNRVAAVDTNDTSGRTYILPTPVENLVVHRDGLRQRIMASGSGDYVVVDTETFRFVAYYASQGASVLVDYDPMP